MYFLLFLLSVFWMFFVLGPATVVIRMCKRQVIVLLLLLSSIFSCQPNVNCDSRTLERRRKVFLFFLSSKFCSLRRWINGVLENGCKSGWYNILNAKSSPSIIMHANNYCEFTRDSESRPKCNDDCRNWKLRPPCDYEGLTTIYSRAWW